MYQEDLTTIMAPISDDEIFIIEDFVGSGDVIIDDIVTTEETVNTTASQQSTFETVVNSTRITTVDTTAALTSEATSTMPLTSSNPTNTLDMILPLIGCTTSGWVGVALFAYYLCKGRRRYTPANAEYSSARLSPGETLV